jgi:hypothetical protein
MAEAAPSLSPKALERIRRHGVAVRTLAQMRARKATLAGLRSQGLRPQRFSAKEIALLAEDLLAQHRAELVAEAIEIINTSPLFETLRLPPTVFVKTAETEHSSIDHSDNQRAIHQ